MARELGNGIKIFCHHDKCFFSWKRNNVSVVLESAPTSTHHKKIFWLESPSHPSGNCSLTPYFPFKNFGFCEPPTPLEFSMTFYGGGGGRKKSSSSAQIGLVFRFISQFLTSITVCFRWESSQGWVLIGKMFSASFYAAQGQAPT